MNKILSIVLLININFNFSADKKYYDVKLKIVKIDQNNNKNVVIENYILQKEENVKFNIKKIMEESNKFQNCDDYVIFLNNKEVNNLEQIEIKDNINLEFRQLFQYIDIYDYNKGYRIEENKCEINTIVNDEILKKLRDLRLELRYLMTKKEVNEKIQKYLPDNLLKNFSDNEFITDIINFKFKQKELKLCNYSVFINNEKLDFYNIYCNMFCLDSKEQEKNNIRLNNIPIYYGLYKLWNDNKNKEIKLFNYIKIFGGHIYEVFKDNNGNILEKTDLVEKNIDFKKYILKYNQENDGKHYEYFIEIPKPKYQYIFHIEKECKTTVFNIKFNIPEDNFQKALDLCLLNIGYEKKDISGKIRKEQSDRDKKITYMIFLKKDSKRKEIIYDCEDFTGNEEEESSKDKFTRWVGDKLCCKCCPCRKSLYGDYTLLEEIEP